MSHPYDGRSNGPYFDQADGVPLVGEERTLPLVDLYPPSETWNKSAPSSTGNPYAQPGYPSAPPQQLQQQPSGWGGPGQYAGPYGPVGQPQQFRPYGMAPQWAAEHPQATTVMVMGLISLAVPILSFVAWVMGNKAKAEIDAGAPYAYGGNLRVGHVIGKVVGIITIVSVVLSILFFILYFVVLVGMFAYIG